MSPKKRPEGSARASPPRLPRSQRAAVSRLDPGHRPVRAARLVVRNGDGSWQFLDGLPIDVDYAISTHAHHLLDEFPADLDQLRHLPRGHLAVRDGAGGPWHIEPFQEIRPRHSLTDRPSRAARRSSGGSVVRDGLRRPERRPVCGDAADLHPAERDGLLDQSSGFRVRPVAWAISAVHERLHDAELAGDDAGQRAGRDVTGRSRAPSARNAASIASPDARYAVPGSCPGSRRRDPAACRR